MNIGLLDRLITIQEQVTTQSATTGEVTNTWATLANVWATMTYPSGLGSSEGTEQSRITASTPVEFIIWYRDDIYEDMRVSFEGVIYDIRRVNRVGMRNEMLKLVTEKKV